MSIDTPATLAVVDGATLAKWIEAQKLSREQAAVALGLSYPGLIRLLNKPALPESVTAMLTSGRAKHVTYHVTFNARPTRYRLEEDAT